MAHFETVLDTVQLALSQASPAEIQALINGLVKAQIVSEGYARSLSLHQLHSHKACRPGWDWSHSQRSTTNWHLHQGQPNQVRRYCSSRCGGSADTDHNQRLEPCIVDETDWSGSRLYDELLFNRTLCSQHSSDGELTDLLRDEDGPVKGSFSEEKEWLQQVEQAARRIAIPLWQHWDRGQSMLLPLLPHTTREFKNTAEYPDMNMEEEPELAVACRTLDLYGDESFSTETEITKLVEGLCFPTHQHVGFFTGHLEIPHTSGHASPVTASADTHNTYRLDDAVMVDRTEDLLWSTPLSSLCPAEETCTDTPNTDLSLTSGDAENVNWTPNCTKMCSRDESKDKDLPDSHSGATMQQLEQVEQDLSLSLDVDLPDDLSEYFSEDCLKTIDPDVLFGDPWLNFGEELVSSDAGVPTEPPSRDGPPQSQSDPSTHKTNPRRKRLRAPRSQRCNDENAPTRPKRRRAAGRLETKEAQADSPVSKGTDAESEPSPAEMTGIPTTPPRILHLHPSIQFITIPEAPHYRVVQTLSLSPPVLGLPLPNTAAAPTYILVPATSPPSCTRQLPPLSPVGGAVAPVQMSSSPPGSQSDSASKAMSPRVASPLSPSCESSPCKESSLPQSPTVPEVPGAVKDYIQEAKAYMSQTCQDMGAGLNLASHYVEVQVSQREISCSGKNTNKFLDRELLSMGSTARQKSMLRGDQIFEGLNGNKPRRYILLLGGAGVGKTTLIKKLCLDWSKDCFPQFDFVFLLDGKALTLREASFSLQTLLLNYSSFAPSCTDPEEVYAQILAAPKRVLVIFDGFYEVRDYETLLQTQERDLVTSLQKDSKAQSYTVRQLYSSILQRVLLPGCTLLLSTRPRGAANQLLRRADSLSEMCGFSPGDVETYLTQYFTDSALRETVLDYLKNCSYLHLLCWIPGLCQLVCLVLEHAKSSEELPRTFTALCHQVLHLTLEKDRRSFHPQAEVQTHLSEAQPQISHSSKQNSTRTRSGSKARSRPRIQRASRAKRHERGGGVCGEESSDVGGEIDGAEERELLSQLSSLAWEGVKASSSFLPTGRNISAKGRAFGQRTGLFLPSHLKRREVTSGDEAEERESSGKGRKVVNSSDSDDDLFLSWANPFLQSYLAGVHLALSRTVSDRIFLQTLPFQSGPKGRRRPQREELELTQRFAVGLLFHDHRELQGLHSYTETAFRDVVGSKRTALRKHLEGLSHGDLSPAQVLEACHCVYEAGKGSSSSPLLAHLAANLPEVLSFHGVPLTSPDVFTLQNVLERGRSEVRCFSLDLESSGIQISGLRALVGLNNINTYRACIADVITFWELLAQKGEEELLQRAVSRFKIHPLKATQVCHIEHLADLVNIHMLKRLSDSSSRLDSIFEDGVPAVRELHKLEFELGPENGPLILPKLWELLPGLHNLQDLDLENSKIGNKGAEKLADALVSLSNLKTLNLSQNCVGDQGVTKLAAALKDLPKLDRLSLYSNVISDEGAGALASVLPHMASLSELDVKYNKFTDAGAKSLAASLKSCKNMKALRMWNQYVPYGTLEWLRQQDSKIALH